MRTSQKSRGNLLSVFACVSISSTGFAQSIEARETAHVLPFGHWSAGLLSPVAIGLGKQVELNTMAVPWLLLSPNASIRAELAHFSNNTVVTSEYGLSLPAGSMYLLKGYLFPSYAHTDATAGFYVVPTAGLWVSTGKNSVLTGRLETTVGIPIGRHDVKPLDTYAPIELIYSPALNGLRERLGIGFDQSIVHWLRARGGLNLYYIGASEYPQKSPWFVSTEALVDIGLGSRVRLTVGMIWYNYDQREEVVVQNSQGKWAREKVRSNDVFPVIDINVGSW